MDQLIAEVRAALKSRLYLLSLQGSLALIDICGGLTASTGEATGRTYRAWYEENLSHKYPLLESKDIYKLRCGTLHQGRLTSKTYEAILFTFPDSGPVFHNNAIDDALNLDVVLFCTDVLDAVEAWWARSRSSEPVATNARHVVTLHPEGIEPFFVGHPVIA